MLRCKCRANLRKQKCVETIEEPPATGEDIVRTAKNMPNAEWWINHPEHREQARRDAIKSHTDPIALARRAAVEETRREKISKAQQTMWTTEMRRQASDCSNQFWADPKNREWRADKTRELMNGSLRDDILIAQRRYNSKKNKIEAMYERMMNSMFPGQWIYTGSGKRVVVIGRMIPDFTHTSEKKVIEIFGTYWHKPEDEEKKINKYAECGYQCLVIWEGADEYDSMRRLKEFAETGRNDQS